MLKGQLPVEVEANVQETNHSYVLREGKDNDRKKSLKEKKISETEQIIKLKGENKKVES